MDKDGQVQQSTPVAPGAAVNSRLTKPRFSCRRWYLLTGNDKDDALAPTISANSHKPSTPASPFLPATSPRPPITKQWGELTGVYAPRQPRSNQRQREAERRRLRDRIYLPSVQHTLQRFRRPQTQAPFQGPAALSLLRVPSIGKDLLSDRLHSLRSSLEADLLMAPTPTLWCPQPPHRDQRPITQRPRPGGRGAHRLRETQRPETTQDSFEQLLEDAESDAATSMSSLETHVCAALSATDTTSSLSSLETHVCAALEAREYAIDAIYGGSREDLLQPQSDESNEMALYGSNSSEDGGMSGYLAGTERSEVSSVSPSNKESSLHLSEQQSDGVAAYTTSVSENDLAFVLSSQTSIESLSRKSPWSIDSTRTQSTEVAPNQVESSKEQDRVVAKAVQSLIDSAQTSPAEEIAEGLSISCVQEWTLPPLDQQDSRVNDPTAPADVPAIVPLTPSEATAPTLLPATGACDPEQTSAKAFDISNAALSGEQDRVIFLLLQSMIDSIAVVSDDAQEEAPTDNSHHPFDEKAEPVLDDEPVVAVEARPELLHDEKHADDTDYTEAEIRSEAHAEVSIARDRTSTLPESDLVGGDPTTEILIPTALPTASSGTGPMGIPACVQNNNNSSDTLVEPEADTQYTEAALHDVQVESEVTTSESTAAPVLITQVVDADDDEDYEELDSELETTDQDPGAGAGPAVTVSDVPTIPASAEDSEPDETYEDDEEEYAGDPWLLNDYEADFDFDAEEDKDAQVYAFDGDDV